MKRVNVKKEILRGFCEPRYPYRATIAAPPTTVRRATAMAPAFDAARANFKGAAELDLEVPVLVLALLVEVEVDPKGLVAVPVVVVALENLEFFR